MTKPIVVWFRRDLRLADHAALSAAAATGRPVIPLFVLDDDVAGDWARGGASRWWLHHSLAALKKALGGVGGDLVLRRGTTRDVIADAAREAGAGDVYCSRGYEPWSSGLETDVRDVLAAHGVAFKRFAGVLLHDPDQVTTQAGATLQGLHSFLERRQAARGKETAGGAKAPDGSIQAAQKRTSQRLGTSSEASRLGGWASRDVGAGRGTRAGSPG